MTNETLRSKFYQLKDQWRKETGASSSLTRMTNSQTHGQIVDLGREVVPILLEDLLTDNPGYWFSALRDILGVDPVHPDHYGDMKRMSWDWVHWGIVNGLISLSEGRPPIRESSFLGVSLIVEDNEMKFKVRIGGSERDYIILDYKDAELLKDAINRMLPYTHGHAVFSESTFSGERPSK